MECRIVHEPMVKGCQFVLLLFTGAPTEKGVRFLLQPYLFLQPGLEDHPRLEHKSVRAGHPAEDISVYLLYFMQ
jgi:hypothetical protein